MGLCGSIVMGHALLHFYQFTILMKFSVCNFFSHSCVSHRNYAGQWFKFAGIKIKRKSINEREREREFSSLANILIIYFFLHSRGISKYVRYRSHTM